VTDIGTTNIWLAVIALALVLQAAVMIGVAVALLQLVRRAEAAVVRVQRRLEPLATAVHALMEDVHWLSETARRAEDSVSTAVQRLGDRVERARDRVDWARDRVTGQVHRLGRVARAVQGVMASINGRRRPAVPTEEDRQAIENFVAEGAPARGAS